jgi:methionyl-tRNA formyltransferase
LKIYFGEKIYTGKDETGKVICDNPAVLQIGCSDGFISVTSLQMEGKKKMSTEEFLRGYKPEQILVK